LARGFILLYGLLVLNIITNNNIYINSLKIIVIYNKMSRNGFKWSVNEVLSLQREYELLEWDINQIAQKHQRSPNAIMFKLDEEGFADYNELARKQYKQSKSYNKKENVDLILQSNDVDSSEESNSETSELTQRVNVLEENIDEIKTMLKQLVSRKMNNLGFNG